MKFMNFLKVSTLSLIIFLNYFSSFGQDSRKAIETMIDTISLLTPVKDEDISKTLSTTQEDYFGVPSKKVEIEHRLAQNFEEIVAFSYDPTILYPGCVIQGKSLLVAGGLKDVTLDRAPGIITVSNLQFKNPGATYSVKIKDPAQGTTETAIRQLLSQELKGEQAARFSFARTEMYSLEQGMFKLGVNARFLTASVKSSFEKNYEKKKSTYIIRYTQIFYDISFQRPNNPVDFFGKGVKLSDARRQMGNGNPPTYISTVSYGRILFVVFSSDESKEKLASSIDAAYSSGFANLDAHLTSEQEKVLKNSSLTVLALGGNNAAAFKPITNPDKLKGLEEYLTGGGVFSDNSQGYPVSYTIKYLKGNSLAKLGYSVNYVEQVFTAIPSIKQIRVNFHTKGDDKDKDESVEIWVRDAKWEMQQTKQKLGPIEVTLTVPVDRGNEVGHDTWGQGNQWENASEKTFVFHLKRPVVIEDCSKLWFRLRKNPDGGTGSGWRMTYDLEGILLDGSTVPIFKQLNELLVGDGNQFDFINMPFICK